MRALISFVLLFVLVTTVCSEAAPPQRSRAVIIGVTRYQNPDWNTLSFPATDARAIGAALIDPDLGGWDAKDVDILTDGDATHGNVEDKIDRALLDSHPGDLVLIYYSGHGFREGNQTYLAMHDTSSKQPSKTALDLDILHRTLIRKGAGAAKVVILDACHSGGVFDGMQGGFLGDLAPGVLILASSGAGEVSSELKERGYGRFTFHLLDALRNASGTSPYVTLGQAWAHITKDIEEQTPQQGGSLGMDVPLVQRPGGVSLNIQPWATVRRITRLRDRKSFVGEQVTPCSIPLPAGNYEIVVGNPNYKEMTITVDVSPGTSTPVQRRFPDFLPGDAINCLLRDGTRQ